MNNSRVLVIILILFIVLAVLIGKLFTIQITQHEKYSKIAERQQNKTIKIKAERGLIKDRNGELLAYTKDDVSLFVDTRMTNKKEKGIIAKRFAAQFGKSEKHYLKKLNSASKNICLEKKASQGDVLSLSDFIASGYFQVEDYSRVYPYGSLASHILGYVDINLVGGNGIEKQFNKNLTGVDGYKYIERDVQGRIVTVNQEFSVKPAAGNNVELTIDKNLQRILEEELYQGLKKYKGKSAMGIIMNPNSGEVLAWSNQPDYDPTHVPEDSVVRRNRALTDMYEPGSTIKPLIMSILLEEELTYEKEVTNTENGKYKVKGVTIRDTHKYEKLNSTDIIIHSSNVGIAKLSDRINDNIFYRYLRDYGFGNITSINIPGEIAGQLKKPKYYSKISKNFISFGYEIGVTPIQLLTAYCALVNGGNLLQPYIVKSVRDADGNYIEEFSSKKIRKVISKRTSKRVIEMMKGAVSDGTGSEAILQNVTVAGKTGTTQRLINKKYSSSDYNASFVGFFPADNPKYISLIIVKSPQIGKYGGRVAAPIFKKIAERIVDSDKNIFDNKKNEKTIDNPQYAAGDEANQEIFITSNLPNQNMDNRIERKIEYSGNRSTMPNLYNYTKRDAIKLMNDLGIKYKIVGSGNVIWQSAVPGTSLENITECEIKCQLSNTNSRLRIN
ncbi:MAG: transpeptidase family protein [Melioribacteraceae bacterium]|nr:transpeptidase family protein [Melioribacteraceae bacterium]